MKRVLAPSECGPQQGNPIAARTVDLRIPAWITRIILKINHSVDY